MIGSSGHFGHASANRATSVVVALTIMAWNFLGIIDATDDDPSLYPIMSPPGTGSPVDLVSGDGSTLVRVNASRLTIGEYRGTAEPETIAELNLDLSLVITDERVLMYCEKFDKGGGWTGFGAGFAVAMVANAVSKARAASRRHGRLLVGHVRYPWLGRVAASPKIDWRTAELLRFTVAAQRQPARVLGLTFTLPKSADAAELASEIARRAACWRLDHDSLNDEQRGATMRLRDCQRAVPTGRYNGISQTFAEHSMPTCAYVPSVTSFGSA